MIARRGLFVAAVLVAFITIGAVAGAVVVALQTIGAMR